MLSCNVSHVIISRLTGFLVALFTGDQFVSLCYEVTCGDDKVGGIRGQEIQRTMCDNCSATYCLTRLNTNRSAESPKCLFR